MDKKRKARPNRFEGLCYNGDWRTVLIAALTLAKQSTASQETLASITALECQLSKNDECIHTFTASLPIPHSMATQFLLGHVESFINIEDSVLCVSPNGEIELTVTARGCSEYVQKRAEGILSRGLVSAQGEIWIQNSRLF